MRRMRIFRGSGIAGSNRSTVYFIGRFIRLRHAAPVPRELK